MIPLDTLERLDALAHRLRLPRRLNPFCDAYERALWTSVGEPIPADVRKRKP